MKENLAYLLWVFFRLEIKWLCKKDYHFYQLKMDENYNPFRQCSVCGEKEILKGKEGTK